MQYFPLQNHSHLPNIYPNLLLSDGWILHGQPRFTSNHRDNFMKYYYVWDCMRRKKTNTALQIKGVRDHDRVPALDKGGELKR